VPSVRGSPLPAEQLDQVQDQAQQELLLVRQRLEDKLSQERRAMHLVLVKKRRELISDMVRRGPPRLSIQTGICLALKHPRSSLCW